MKIKLENDWRYYHKGEVIDVNKVLGEALLEQNIGIKVKEIDKPHKDKMMRTPGKKKGKDVRQTKT